MKDYDPKHDWALRQMTYHDWFDRRTMTEEQITKLKMLRPLRAACKECTMCRLGRIEHIHRDEKIDDPHVFSNMMPSRFMVVGQNPGFNECIEDEPFVGDAGNRFNTAIQENGLSRDMFYISNVVKCHTPDNRKPETDEVEACEPYLRMEIKLLRPIIVVALGSIAFEMLCPAKSFSDNLGIIVKSRLGVNVYPVYHPSPRNMIDQGRRKRFDSDIVNLCRLVKKLIEDGNASGREGLADSNT